MKTITFYSYKGGVGRTLALANLTQYLTQKGHNVFVLDLDIAAPGVPYKLPPNEDDKENSNLGFISYFNSWHTTGKPPDDLETFIYEYQPHLPSKAKIQIMPAGNPAKDIYWRKLRELNWHSIFTEGEGFELLLNLKYQIRDCATKPDYLLIDARTGIGEVGGFVTKLLSDSVVLLFNNNDENLDGILNMAQSLSVFPLIDRQQPIKIFPVTVRHPVIDSEYDENINNDINVKFKKFFKESIDKIDLQSCQILHTDREIEVAEYLLIGNPDANKLSILYQDYQILFKRLLGQKISGEQVLTQSIKVSYSERMSRVIPILESLKLELLKKDIHMSITNLWKKIEIGKVTDDPQADTESGKLRPEWDLEQLKIWERNLSKNLKSSGEFQEFWVLLPDFLAYRDPDFFDITAQNLIAGVKYIYFLANSEDRTRLETVARDIISNFKAQANQGINIELTVKRNLRYVFVTDKNFRAYLRHHNSWIANPQTQQKNNNTFPLEFAYPTNPQGLEVITEINQQDQGERSVKRGIPLKEIECQEIVKLVTYSLGNGKDLEGSLVIK